MKSRLIFNTFATICLSASIVACGDKPADSTAPSAASASSQSVESKEPKAKSISKDLASYKDVVLTKEITEEVWKGFVLEYGRLAAAKPGITDKDLAVAAYPEIAGVQDPFKREELTSAKVDDLKALRSAATPKIRLVAPSTAFLSSYDMEKESYVVNFQGAGGEFTTPWTIPNVTTAYLSLKYCMEKGQGGRCAQSRSVEIKVPKDRARVIEAELAKRNSRTLALGLYSTVKDFTYGVNSPERSTLELHIEAVSLHLFDQRNEWDIDYKNTLIFIDGPDLQNTTTMRS